MSLPSSQYRNLRLGLESLGKRRKRKKIILLNVILSVLFVYVLMTAEIKIFRFQSLFWTPENATITTTPRRYIGCRFWTLGVSGLGNRFFEVLALTAIGRRLDRIPYIKADEKRALDRWPKLLEMFPNLKNLLEIRPVQSSTIMIDFNMKCCTYDDPNRLKNYTDEDIYVKGRFFQSYKYFHFMREEIRNHLLKFQKCDIDDSQKSLFDGHDLTSNMHRICVHTRRGDFVKTRDHQPSDANFTLKAIKYVVEKNNNVSTSVFVFGNDRKWSQSIFGDQKDVTVPVYIAKPQKRPSVDLAFSSLFCDSLVLTASSSTFAFWMAYLAKDGVTVYYNKSFAKKGVLMNEFNPKDFFLAHWKSLKF